MASTAKGTRSSSDYLVGRIDAAMAELSERRRNIDAMVAELGEVKTVLQRTLAAKRRARKA
jgi:predicted metal-dependent hydrolase